MIRSLIFGAVLTWSLLFLLFSAPNSCEASGQTIPFETIEIGQFSGFHFGEEEFQGAEFLITDPESWEQFWEVHTGGYFPLPSLPEVDFDTNSVLAVFLGYRNSVDGTPIQIDQIVEDDEILWVHVVENRMRERTNKISNPYHIVRIPRCDRAIAWIHEDLTSISCQINEDCPAGFVCEHTNRACKTTDIVGHCIPIPVSCPNTRDPVCGCDGVTYQNDCYRLMAGANLWHDGACK